METSTEVNNRFELLRSGRKVPAEGGRTFTDYSPITGIPFATVAAASTGDAMAAVAAAHTAGRGWATASFVERRGVLLRAADILESEIADYRSVFASEIGAVANWADMNVRESAATLREAAALTSAPIGEILPSHIPTSTNHSRRSAAGVVLAIVPWNAPLILAARSIAIAIAAGNSIVIRPSEESPVTAGFLLASALERAGLPPGVVNVVTSAPGEGRGLIAKMIQHPAVRRVVFIGSTPVGKAIASIAGSALTPAVMELGGKNATIVRADADLDRWVPVVAFSAFANSGQVCMATDRIIAHSSIAQELSDRLAAYASGMTVGDPRDLGTDLGPLINGKAAAAFQELVHDAEKNGASVLAGGRADGLYAQPTVLTGVGQHCRYFQEEGFAPIVSVAAAATDDEAVSMANEGPFGLIASVISEDRRAAISVADRLHAGAVQINGPTVGDEPHVPFGGLGESGFGRLGGADSLRFFTEQRTYYIHDEQR